jgi:K+ transporter
VTNLLVLGWWILVAMVVAAGTEAMFADLGHFNVKSMQVS